MRSLSFLTLSLSLSACVPFNDDSGEGRDRNSADVVAQTAGTPIEYGLFDAACQDGDKGQIGEGIIAGASFGDRAESALELRARDGMISLSESAAVSYRARALKLCDPAAKVPENTLEGVALTSMGHLNKAHDFYRSLAGSKTLAEAAMQVHPTFQVDVTIDVDTTDEDLKDMLSEDGEEKELKPEDYNKHLRVVMTDNAAWGHDEDKGETFYIFPQSQESVANGWFGGTPLWQRPFVLAHEFGHHVFFSHVPKLADEEDEATHIIQRTGIPVVDRAIEASFASSDDGASSVNEGFADLFAHYSLAGQTEIDSITCMRVTRDVTSRTFVDGEPKKLTDAVWAEFEKDEDEAEKVDTETPAPKDVDCAQYAFKDTHIIGALVAHGVYRLFQEMDASAGGDSVRGAALLSWAKAQDERLGSYNSAADIIGIAIDTAFATAWSGKAAGSDQKMCAIVDEVFPKFAAELKSDADSSYAKSCFPVTPAATDATSTDTAATP